MQKGNLTTLKATHPIPPLAVIKWLPNFWQRYKIYLHEVLLQKNLQNSLLSKTGALPNSRTEYEGLAKVLQNFQKTRANE